MKILSHILLIVMFSAGIVSASPKVGKIASRDYDPSRLSGRTRNVNLIVQCDISSLEKDIVRKGGYDFYMIDGFDQSAVEPGAPVLPSRFIRVLIPEGYEFYKIKEILHLQQACKWVSKVFPKQKESRIGNSQKESFVPLKIKTTGRRESIEYVHTAKIRNHRMAVFRFSPVQFEPSSTGAEESGTFTITTSLQLSVILRPETTAELPTSFKTARSETLIDSYIADAVVNPEDLEPTIISASAQATSIDSTACDYLIITAQALEDEFQVLADHRAAMGLTVDIVTVEDIYANYDGSSQQVKIKKCILDYAENKGTLWVLLGGDDTIVPDHDCYGSVNGGGTTDLTIPTDLYYAGLDDMNWNDDGDAIPCEIVAKGDSIDLYPDLFVGRAPVRSGTDAQVFASKTIAYETAVYDPYFHEAALFMGVKMWASDLDRSDADWKSEELWARVHEDRSFVLPANKYRFYDTGTDFSGGADYNVTKDNISDEINFGYGVIWVATHGNNNVFSVESGENFSSSTAGALVNQDYQGIVYTMACSTNWFDSQINSTDGYKSTIDPGLSEAFIRNSDGGAVAYIGSSRYSWGYSYLDSENLFYGPSFKYAEEFFKMLYYDEDLLSITGTSADPTVFGKRIGAVFASHKMAKAPDSLFYGSTRWLQFSLNLMGDPFTRVMVKLPQDSDLDRDIDGEDLAAFVSRSSTTVPDLWELAQRFGSSFSQ
nr:C25 family cysteine peptidase [uncultured Desulfobacter sp.]